VFSSHRWRPIAHSLRPNVALLLLAAVVCGACGGSTGDGIVTPPPPPPPDPSVASVIAVSQQTVQLSAIGHTATVTATVRDQRGREMPSADVQWTMQDTAVATVSSTGVVVARRNGTTQARVASGALSAVVEVQVRQRVSALSSASSSRQFASLGDTSTFPVLAVDANRVPVADAVLQWSSSNEQVVRVLDGGRFVSVGNGTATVHAQVDAVRWSGEASVRQLPATLQLRGQLSDSMVVSDSALTSVVVRDQNGHAIMDVPVVITSSNPQVVAIERSSMIRALRAGDATITASVPNGPTSPPHRVVVGTRRLEPIPPFLATPAANASWEIPVVIIRYLPTLDGRRVDSVEASMRGTLDEVRSRITVLEERVKFMLEEGSRFRGYRDATALPSVGYRVLHIVTVYEHFTRGQEVPWNRGHYFPDYHRILEAANARTWVEQRGVKEFWVWGYHSEKFEQPESNMSSPVTGDISNSARSQDDLPVFNRTYTVYGYNFARTQAEAVHNHGHQLEAILGHIDPGIFWTEFVGRSAANSYTMGRAGWTHMPPNTLTDYDYLNTRRVASDIADWRPGGGATSEVSLETWATLPYRWPTALAPGERQIAQRDESQWYIYWMQNMPGRGNQIPATGGGMTNWWHFTGDWDQAMRSDVGLTTSRSVLTIRNDYHGDITLSPGGVLRPGQTATLATSAPLTVNVWTCGTAGCRWSPFFLQPRQTYKVVLQTGGNNELVIVSTP